MKCAYKKEKLLPILKFLNKNIDPEIIHELNEVSYEAILNILLCGILLNTLITYKTQIQIIKLSKF